jgi:hypothetical protein
MKHGAKWNSLWNLSSTSPVSWLLVLKFENIWLPYCGKTTATFVHEHLPYIVYFEAKIVKFTIFEYHWKQEIIKIIRNRSVWRRYMSQLRKICKIYSILSWFVRTCNIYNTNLWTGNNRNTEKIIHKNRRMSDNYIAPAK